MELKEKKGYFHSNLNWASMGRRAKPANLTEKTNRILNSILVVLVLVAVKVWHIAVVQHEKKQEESKKPQRRIVIERSARATIYDRFNIPLAINKVQYNAAICYGPIRELPRWKWEKSDSGRVKRFIRNEYITRLAKKLGRELELDDEWLEDIIHSKAAILGNVPCVIKENISERQYFRLKMLEKDWPGIQGEIAAKRHYPWGPISGEVVGYIGPISRQQYESVTREMAQLRAALVAYEEGDDGAIHVPIEEIRGRLEELERKAYHINDLVGKMGVEATYDEALRGLRGRRVYLSDTRGKFLRELPGAEEAVPGNRLILTLSAELQAFAHQLLAEYEKEPFCASPSELKRKSLIPEYQPWMKGGAIVALDPLTGEVYALASFPTLDPNDFIRPENDPESMAKAKRVNQWLESEKYLADVWDLNIPYTRQRFSEGYQQEQIDLSWNNYLAFILPKKSEVRITLEKHGTLADALFMQQTVEQMMALFSDSKESLSPSQILDSLYPDPQSSTGSLLTLQQKSFLAEKGALHKERIALLKAQLEPYFSPIDLNYEKLLLTDLYRVAVDASAFPPSLGELIGGKTINDYRERAASCGAVISIVKEIVKQIFLDTEFKTWRKEKFAQYLAEKRGEERAANQKYPRPYIEYLEKVRKELFDQMWKKYQWEFVTLFLTGKSRLEEEELVPYLATLKQWAEELSGGAHVGLEWVPHYHSLVKQIVEFSQMCRPEASHDILIAFLQSSRQFNQLTRPLLGVYNLRGKEEKDLAAAFYPLYGFGYARSQAFRQATTLGSIFKLVTAYEALRQTYVRLQEKGQPIGNLNPLTIIDDKHLVKKDTWNVGYTADGRPIPMYYKGGRLPRSEHAGVGKIDLVRALAASSNPYFALLASDVLEDPEDVGRAAALFGYGEKTGIDLPGEYKGRLPADIAYNRSGLYSLTMGQHTLTGTPLQTATMLAMVANGGLVLKPHVVKYQISKSKKEKSETEVRWRVFMPPQIRDVLYSGLKQVVMGEKGTARKIKHQFDSALLSQIMGKTSTSEVIERMSLDGQDGQVKLKHVWFGGISFDSDDNPELIVVVYLRYGGWGKDAAPLAVEMVKKWRELKEKYGSSG